MADVFISYSRADRETAKIFADAFVAQGWTVWWDPAIFYGTQYDKVIEEELSQAKCIVVLWSKGSVGSRWVRSEASKGVERSALVPIRIEADAEVPLEFTKIQTAELAGWDGDCENQTFKGLVRGIERVIASETSPGELHERPRVDSRPHRLSPTHRILVHVGLLAAPTLVILLLAGLAMRIHRPTAFGLDLTVTRLSFVSAAEQAAMLVDKTAFTALEVHGIEKGSINGERAHLLRETDSAGSALAESVTRSPLPLPVAIAQHQSSGASAIFSYAGGGESTLGDLDRLFLPPDARAEVGVTRDDQPALLLRILDQPSRIVLSMHGESNVDLVGARVSTPNGDTAIEAPTSTLQLEADQSGSLVEFLGTKAGPTLLLTAANGAHPSIALAANLRVSDIGFQTQGPTGAAVTTVSGDGTIGFPGTPNMSKVGVTGGQYVVVSGLANFFIRKLTFAPELGGIHLQAGGTAESLKAGPAGGVQEHALTWFDSLWHQPQIVQLFGLAVWLLPTTLAAYKLLKELKQ